MSRTITAALVTSVAAMALDGCYGVRVEQASQRDGIGDTVRVEATLDADARGLPGQYLAAFLVPAAAAAPATVDARLPGETASTAMARKPSLDETLQDTRPAPAGRRWVGYVSGVVGLPAGVQTAEDAAQLVEGAAARPAPEQDDATWTVRADFGIARGDGGLPTPTAFDHAVMGGFRLALPDAVLAGAEELPGDAAAFALALRDGRPVDCREERPWPFAELFGEPPGGPTVPTTVCGPTSAGGSLALADLRGSGATAEAAPGTTATVPFTLRSVGPAGPRYGLAASTGLDGATAAPSIGALTPGGPGFHDVVVAVAVPAGARPGGYDVVLSATAGGERREAVGRVVVSDPAVAAAASGEPELGAVLGITIRQTPERTLRFSALAHTWPGRHGRVRLGQLWCLNERAPCRVRVRLAVGGLTLGHARLRVRAQARRAVAVRVGRRARRLLAVGHVLDAVVTVRRADDDSAIAERLTLRRRP